MIDYSDHTVVKACVERMNEGDRTFFAIDLSALLTAADDVLNGAFNAESHLRTALETVIDDLGGAL